MGEVIDKLNPMSNFDPTTYDGFAISGGTSTIGVNATYLTRFSLTNPVFTLSNFLSYCPEFKEILKIVCYKTLFDSYYGMANNCLDYNRFGYDWYYLTTMFIAHYLAMTLGRLYNMQISKTSDITNIQNQIMTVSNQPIGLRTKENLGGEEVDVDNMITVSTNKAAGQFLTTPYGREFWDKYIGYARNFFRGVI